LYITDTNPLVFYAANQTKKLSKRALQIFEACEKGNNVIYISAVVLWEFSLLSKAGKIKIKGESFQAWCQKLLKQPTFIFLPLELKHIFQAYEYNFHSDPFDLLIVATAKNLDIPLITKDSIITDANIIDVVW